MAEYIYGTKEFSYKFVLTAHPPSLNDLVKWAGIEQHGSGGALITQCLAPAAPEYTARFEWADSAGWLTGVYQMAVPLGEFGIYLSSDIEGAISQVCDQALEVVKGLERVLPGPAWSPDIGYVSSFSFYREDWPQLADRIGHGARIDDRASLDAALEAALRSGEDNDLPAVAASALIHAIDNDLELMELVDSVEHAPRPTTLWSVAQDYMHTSPTEFADREAQSRLYAYNHDWDEAYKQLQALLRENPNAFKSARMMFAGFIWDDTWDQVLQWSNDLLQLATTNEAIAEYHQWRGESYWAFDETEAALEAAKASAAHGRSLLLDELRRNAIR